jgi:hypothetical protein
MKYYNSYRQPVVVACIQQEVDQTADRRTSLSPTVQLSLWGHSLGYEKLYKSIGKKPLSSSNKRKLIIIS